MVSFLYRVQNPLGLHARPVGLLVKYVSQLPCEVTLRCGARWANARQVFSVMAMEVACGEVLTVEIWGGEEEQLVGQLERFLKDNL